MSVFAPSLIGIRSSQTFAKQLLSTTIELRDTDWSTAAGLISAATLNSPSAIVVHMYYGTANAHDQALDVQLHFDTTSAGSQYRVFYSETGIIPAEAYTTLILGPHTGDAVGTSTRTIVRNVPLLAYYPSDAALLCRVRTTGGSVAPTTGTLTLKVTGYY